MSDINVNFMSPNRRIFMQPVHFIGAANLARLTDTLLMLPLTLYHCCYLGGELLDGWTREDDSVERLSNEDLQRCVNARLKLGRQELLVVARVFDEVPRERCKDRRPCSPYIARMGRHLVHEDNLQLAGDALWDWSVVVGAFEGLCEGCKEALCARGKTERRRVWNTLPRILGIAVEGWGELDGGEEVGDGV